MDKHAYVCQMKVSGLKDLLRTFYEDNRIHKDDLKINPILYPKETKLSFEKCVSLAVLPGWKEEKSMSRESAISLLWGSSSDACVVKVEKETSYLYTFTTYSSPPTIWFHAISQKYMYLTFEVSIHDEQGNVYHSIFEKGEKRAGVEEKPVEEKNKKDGNLLFETILTHLQEKKIDAKKYMKRIYEKHYQGAEKRVENIDYEGLLEDFVEKVKIHKYIQKVCNGDDSPIYEESRAFVEYVLSDRK